MKSALLTALHQLQISDREKPVIKDDHQVLLRMQSVGVCGSDIHYFTTGRIGGQVVEYPFSVGHEGAATVEAVGPAVSRVKPGDRVAIEPAIACHRCDQCLAGRENTCRNLRFLGCPGQLEGCLSEFIVMPEECCLPIPANLSFDEAALLEPLAIGLYAVRQSMLTQNARIGILGLGPIGLSVMLCARSHGSAAIYGSDLLDYRGRAAVEHGATWAGNPGKIDIVEQINQFEPQLLDVVFECCGQQSAFDQAARLLKPGGKLMLIGIPQFERYSFMAELARRQEICIQHVRRQNHCTETAMGMVAEGRIEPAFMATHQFPLAHCEKAFSLVENYDQGVIKAMIHFEQRQALSKHGER